MSFAKRGWLDKEGRISVKGFQPLIKKLESLEDKSTKKAMTAGIRAGMTPIAKAMRAAVNATDASAELKREARKTIGSRFGKNKAGRFKGVKEAKVGFAVGKTMKSRKKKTGMGKSSGVGLSASNIHWFVLGTDERTTESGKPTGKIEGVFGDVTRQALASSSGAALAAARRKISDVMQREARKGV